MLAFERVPEIVRLVAVAEAAPQNEVSGWRDRRGGLELHEGQLAHHLDEIGGPTGIQQLGAHRDASHLLEREFDDHVSDRIATWGQEYGILEL